MKVGRLLAKLLLGGASFAFTIFVFTNTYEVVANKDIAFADSVQKMSAQTVINRTISAFQTKPGLDQSTDNSRLDNMQYFTIPDLHTTVQMEAARRIDRQWYERPSVAQYIGLNKDAAGTTVDYLVYLRQSWRTMPTPSQLEVGMQVKFYYAGGSSLFEVADKTNKPLDTSFLTQQSESRQILLIVEDPTSQTYFGFSLLPAK